MAQRATGRDHRLGVLWDHPVLVTGRGEEARQASEEVAVLRGATCQSGEGLDGLKVARRCNTAGATRSRRWSRQRNFHILLWVSILLVSRIQSSRARRDRSELKVAEASAPVCRTRGGGGGAVMRWDLERPRRRLLRKSEEAQTMGAGSEVEEHAGSGRWWGAVPSWGSGEGLGVGSGESHPLLRRCSPLTELLPVVQ